jgi:hypothetical protein
MRIAAIIIATLCLLVSGGLGLVRSSTNFKDAKDLGEVASVNKELVSVAKAAKIEGASVLEVKPGALKRGGVGFIFVGVLSIITLISIFVKRGVPIFAGALAAVALISIILNPQYDTGSMGPMSARNAAILVGVFAMIGAGFAFLADRIRLRRAARA